MLKNFPLQKMTVGLLTNNFTLLIIFFSVLQLLKSSLKTKNKIYTAITSVIVWGMSVAFALMLFFTSQNSM